jgi:hypothetical protein
MLHFQKRAARLATIYNRIKRVGSPAVLVDALKPGTIFLVC